MLDTASRNTLRPQVSCFPGASPNRALQASESKLSESSLQHGEKLSVSHHEPSTLSSTDAPTVHAPPSSAAQFLASYALRGQDQQRATTSVRVSFRSPDGRVGNRDEQTHLLHWFPAKMFYRIPIDILDTVPPPPGGLVLDPFCGSGTVLVEARARGHRTIGMDINPLSCLISQVKTTPLDGPTLHEELLSIITRAKRLRRTPATDVLPQYWFRPSPRRTLYRLYSAICEANMPAAHRRFFVTSLTSIVRRCSLADPNIPPPVRLNQRRLPSAGYRYQRAYDHAQALDAAGVYDLYLTSATKNIIRVSESLALHFPRSYVYRRSAMNTSLPDASVDTIITSPPYCGAQKYVRTFKLELSLLGFTPKQISAIDRRTLGTERVSAKHRSTENYLSQGQKEILESIASVSRPRSMMLSTYLAGLNSFAKEICRLLKPDGNAFITFGTSTFVKRHALDFADIFAAFARSFDLVEVARLTDPIPSRGMITKRHHAASVIPTETVIWLRHQ